QQQRDRHGGRRKGDHDTRDDHRLRHRIGAEPRRRSPARDDAEEHERAATEQVEAEYLAERLRIHDEAVEPATRRRPAETPEQGRGANRRVPPSGAPASSRPSATAIVSVIGTSMARISGLAYAWG